MRFMILFAAMAGTMAGTGAASTATASERTGYASIAAGDLSGAERTLIAERRIFPERPELMLNLAAVYQQTGRTMEAASLYRAVLARPVVAMDLPSGATRSSHTIAQAALARIAPTFANR